MIKADIYPYITSVWDNGFGFIKIDVTKNILFGEFYANEVADNTEKEIIEPNYLIRDKLQSQNSRISKQSILFHYCRGIRTYTLRFLIIKIMILSILIYKKLFRL
jgi:hypothetical protein